MHRVYARRLFLVTLALIVVLTVVFAVVQGG